MKNDKEIEIVRASWPEAEVIADPLPAKKLADPVVLVRRRQSLLLGSREEQLVYLPGMAAISLFTGAGGFDIGLEAAGFCCLVQHEWEQACCATLIANRPGFFRHAALIQGDIRKTPTSLLLREANLRVGEAHILTGGPPCQGFSTSNSNRKRAEVEGDQRNDLVFEFLRVVREAKPKFFVFENVPGFISFNKGAYMRSFLETAYACYYELVYGLVNAVEYGVPQDRTRFICMATRRDLVDCDSILGSLPAPECFGKRDLDYLGQIEGFPLFAKEHRLLTHPPGIRYFPDRPVLIPPRPAQGTHFDGRTKAFVEFYRELEAKEPDRIVRAPVGGQA